MATNLNKICPIDKFTSIDLLQEKAGCSPLLLQLPREILEMIGSWVATGHSPEEAGKNAIRFGQVCILTHLISHDHQMGPQIINIKIDFGINGLVKAIIERPFTASEFGRHKTSDDRQIRSVEIDKCNFLYETLQAKASLSDIKENSIEFACLSLSIQKIIKDLCSRNRTTETVIKTCTALQTLTEKTLKIINDEYANQPLGNISIENFKEKIQILATLFKEIGTAPYTFHETRIRKTILATHDQKEFQTILNDRKNILETKLKNEYTNLEQELFYLRGPNGFNGAIHNAYQKQQNSEDKNEEYTHLVNRLNQITVFNSDGKIVGGRLLEVYIELQSIQINDKVSQFYFELSQTNLEGHEEIVRMIALHKIIN